MAVAHDIMVRDEEALIVDMAVNFYRYDSRSIECFKEHLYAWDAGAKAFLLDIYRYLGEIIKAGIAFKNIIYVEGAMTVHSYVKTSAWLSITVGGGLIRYVPKVEVFS